MIKAYIGLPGTGKTFNMVFDLMKLMVDGNRVISNTPINFKVKGKEYSSEYVGSRKEFERKIIYEENCVLAVDEASIFFPSYFWDKLPGEYIMKFAQTRKYKTDIYYTTQRFSHTMRRLRDLTNIVTKCSNASFPLLGRIFVSTDYDPEFFEQRIIASPAVEKKYILSTRRIYPSSARRVYSAFNTLHRVEASALVDIKPQIHDRSEDLPSLL